MRMEPQAVAKENVVLSDVVRVVPLPDDISIKLKRQAETAMSKIAKSKKRGRPPKKLLKITHDRTKVSRELFGAGIDTPDWPEVKRFLRRHPKVGLPSLLVDTSPVLRDFFGTDAKLVLDVLKSPVRRSKKACLYLTIQSTLTEEAEGLAYDRFVEIWWALREARVEGLLTIGILSDDKTPIENLFAETRGECLSAFKKCDATWCRFHLHSDVHPSSIAFQVHGEEACVLRLAQKSNHTLEEIGAMFGCTRERIRQIELVATRKTGYRLHKNGVISTSEVTREVWNRIRSSRKQDPFTIEDDRFRKPRVGRPRKFRDEDQDDQDDGD